LKSLLTVPLESLFYPTAYTGKTEMDHASIDTMEFPKGTRVSKARLNAVAAYKRLAGTSIANVSQFR